MAKVFVVCGSPGAGKSTYGGVLAKRRQAALIDIDTCTERLVQAALENLGKSPADRDSEYFKGIFRAPIYQTLFSIAKENLAWIDAVIVGPFTQEIRDPQWPEKLKRLLEAEVEVHYVYCEPSERKGRLERRGNPRDIPKLEHWEDHVGYLGDERAPEFPHEFINTSAICKV